MCECARTVLCGGKSVTIVPTASAIGYFVASRVCRRFVNRHCSRFYPKKPDPHPPGAGGCMCMGTGLELVYFRLQREYELLLGGCEEVAEATEVMGEFSIRVSRLQMSVYLLRKLFDGAPPITSTCLRVIIVTLMDTLLQSFETLPSRSSGTFTVGSFYSSLALSRDEAFLCRVKSPNRRTMHVPLGPRECPNIGDSVRAVACGKPRVMPI